MNEISNTHFETLRKSYDLVGDETWKQSDFSNSNLQLSRKLFTDNSLANASPRPKALEVYALLSGLPFSKGFTTPLIEVQQRIDEVLDGSLRYWVNQPNLGLEYCVFKWPDDSWSDEKLKEVLQELEMIDQSPYGFYIDGIQINPDGCVVARGFDESGRLFAIRDRLKSKLSFLPKKQSQWAHIPLGRILEPLGSEKFSILGELVNGLNDTPVFETTIDVLKLVHETRWYMEERTTVAEIPLSSAVADDNYAKS